MNTASRSNTSISGSASSPWIRKVMPIFSMRASTRRILVKSLTPAAEFVVALAGYIFTAVKTPSRKPVSTSSGSVASVR
jgi:hypothetical protein